MKRNCNLELRLVTSSPPLAPHSPPLPSRGVYYEDSSSSIVQDEEEEEDYGRRIKDERQFTSLFYNGAISPNCDATELQARAILWVAARGEVEEKVGSAVGISMKGSLKSFLDRRKSRAQATSPHPSLN